MTSGRDMAGTTVRKRLWIMSGKRTCWEAEGTLVEDAGLNNTKTYRLPQSGLAVWQSPRKREPNRTHTPLDNSSCCCPMGPFLGAGDSPQPLGA
ncbi:MAG: hypothetical protein OXG60_19130 [Chloroflexi bacterium]|nr:hypothetical protein [Chloroflexota bacterium]